MYGASAPRTVNSPPPPVASAANSIPRYAIGVGITVVAILSQYFVPELVPATLVLYGNLPGDLFVVYGIPVLAFALLIGFAPLENWYQRTGPAFYEGLGWFGALSILALVITAILLIVYGFLDPSAIKLLDKPNPALTQAQSDPWFWVGFSFVVGAFEETIFRGWIFGFWRFRTSNWISPALWTSAVFAGVHLYYGETYGAASGLIFPSLFLTGFAFAATYQATGGNLLVVALLHGASDATAFLTLVSLTLGIVLHYVLILVGGILALVIYLDDSHRPMFAPDWARPEVQGVGERISSTQIPSGPS
jgi:membrane protease YdiL (CAAX protease family)